MKSSHTVKYNKHVHIVNDGCHTMFVARQKAYPNSIHNYYDFYSLPCLTSKPFSLLDLYFFWSFPPEFSLTNFSKANFYHYRMVVVHNVMGINV